MVLGKQLLGAIQSVLVEAHDVLAPQIAQLAEVEVVGGNEIERLIEFAGELIRNNSQLERSGPSGAELKGRRACQSTLDEISSGQFRLHTSSTTSRALSYTAIKVNAESATG